MHRGVDESGLSQPFEERPLPNRPRDSVRPGTFLRDFVWRDTVLEQDIGHLQAVVSTKHAIRFSPNAGFVDS